MCSELFRIPYQWDSVPIFGAGLLLAVWLAIGAWTLFRVARAHGWDSAEFWSYVPLLLLVAAAIVFLPRLFPGGLPIRGYGLMLLLAAVAGVGLAAYRAEQVGIDRDLIFSLAFWLFVCGILGARVFYVIEYWDVDFQGGDSAETVAKVLNFPQGGLVIYGGFLGGVAAFFLFVRRHRLPTLAMGDLVAPALMVGLAIGRIGCLLNGCCYGGVSDLPWAVTFPRQSAPDQYSPPYQDQVSHGELYGFRLLSNDQRRPQIVRVDAQSAAGRAGLEVGDVVTRIDGYDVTDLRQASIAIWEAFWGESQLALQTDNGKHLLIPAASIPTRSLPVHPTQLYSTINAGLIAWLLWSYYPFRRRDGEVLALMLTVYPLTRFVLEIIRTDETAIFGTGMSISQNISIVLLAGAAVGWLCLWSGKGRLALPADASSLS